MFWQTGRQAPIHVHWTEKQPEGFRPLGCPGILLDSRAHRAHSSAPGKQLLRAFVTDRALFIDIVHVVARRRFNTPLHVVAQQTLIPPAQSVRDVRH